MESISLHLKKQTLYLLSRNYLSKFSKFPLNGVNFNLWGKNSVN